jgi:hypothetical protein
VNERFASAGNLRDEFHLAFVAGFGKRCLAADFRALIFDEEREVHDA